MLAGVQQIAMVMAGFFVVMLAHSIWAARFRTDVAFLFSPFDFWIREVPLWIPMDAYASGYIEGLISLGIGMWLIGHLVRRAKPRS